MLYDSASEIYGNFTQVDYNSKTCFDLQIDTIQKRIESELKRKLHFGRHLGFFGD